MSVTGGIHHRPFGVIVLSGGTASRLGGVAKPELVVRGRTLLETVIAAGRDAGAGRVVVAGPRRGSADRCVREDPPGGGPVPALRRGLAELADDGAGAGGWVAVLAADLPFLRGPHVAALLAAAAAHGAGAVLADDDGRPQWLAGCWHVPALCAALENYDGNSLRGLLGPLDPAQLQLGGTPPPWLDCDTPDDLVRARLYSS
jgi:molybdopterin-guanine dinucleotide biosynthesis protein A